MFFRTLVLIFICLSASFTNYYLAYAENFQVTIPPGAATSVENEAFIPSTISIPVNSTVMWKNNDTTPHTATADNASVGSQSFDSGLLSPGKTFEVTFNKPGNYQYQCMLHPFMRGAVMVGLSNTTLESGSAALSDANVTQGDKQLEVEQSPITLGAKKIDGAYVWESNGRNNPILNLMSNKEYNIIVRSISGDPAEHELKVISHGGEDILESEGVEGGEETQLSLTVPGAPGTMKYYCVYHPQSMVGIINVVNSIDNSNMSNSMINMSSTGNQGMSVDDRRGEDRDDDDHDGDRRGRGGSEDDGSNRGPG